MWDFDSCLGNYPNYSGAGLMHAKDTNTLFRKQMSSPAFTAYVGTVFSQHRSAFAGFSRYASERGAALADSAAMSFT